KWAPECQNPIADFYFAGITQAKGVEIGGVNLQHRQVSRRICADYGGADLPSVVQLYFDPAPAIDHVVISQDITRGVDDNARTQTVLPPVSGNVAKRTLIPEESPKHVFLRRGLDHLFRTDVNDGVFDLLRHRCETLAQIDQRRLSGCSFRLGRRSGTRCRTRNEISYRVELHLYGQGSQRQHQDSKSHPDLHSRWRMHCDICI